MALLDLFRRSQAPAAAAVLDAPRRARIASPWGPQLTASVLAADWLGAHADAMPATRQEAMRVPAIVAARNVLVGALSGGVLRAYRGDELLPSQPAWLYRTDSNVPPQVRLAWTVDDLLFGGYSLWATARGAGGQIVDAVRVPAEQWTFEDDYAVLVDDRPVEPDEVILFTSWDEGLLLTGASTIRGALDLARMVRTRVRNPIPVTTIRATDPQAGLDDDEIDALLSGWVNARRDPDTGGVVYIPPGLDVAEYGSGNGVSLFEQGRNAEVLDISRLTGIPASLLDASQVAASLTYETREGARAVLNDRLRARAQFIDARLSADDCTPRGTRVSLDLSHLTGPETGTAAPTED